MFKKQKNGAQIIKLPCTAHRNSIPSMTGDHAPYVRKDVFGEYAKRMDERCGNHEDTIKQVNDKIDKTNTLLTGLVISLLLTGIGFLLNLLSGLL